MMAIVPELRRRFGITRLSETTYLDRIDIPTMSAFVPASDSTLGVYSGKGATRDEALVSAVMEAVERQSCYSFQPNLYERTRDRLEGHFDFANLPLAFEHEHAMPCVPGIDLLSGKSIDVPAGLVNPSLDRKRFNFWTSTGLAAGSTLAECVCHALLELVERHLLSEVEIRAALWPRYLHARFGFDRGPHAWEPADLPFAPELSLPTGDPRIDHLVERIGEAGTSIRIFIHARERWPTAAMAVITQLGASRPMAHGGMGCSWSSRVAVERAVLEAVSSRVISIQGAREDLFDEGKRTGPAMHRRRSTSYPNGRWFFDLPAKTVSLGDLPERSTSDVAEDTRMLLDTLRTEGIRSVAVVDVSPPDAVVHVARVIALDLERCIYDPTLSKRMLERFANGLALR